MKFVRPNHLQEALEILAGADSAVTPIAGGTDIMVSWYHRNHDSLVLMDLSKIQELRPWKLTTDHLELGALTTYWDVIDSAILVREFPLLTEAALQVGAIQIQSRGTWAGNIANGSPAADGVPVMMACDASVCLQSLNDQREVPLDEFFTGYKKSVRQNDELITAIRLPRRERDVQWWHKVGARSAQAISKVGVAIVHDALGWHVSVNSVAPYVCRCHHLERALDQRGVFENPQQIEVLLKQDISPIDDIRSTARYRQKVLARLIYYWWSEHAIRQARVNRASP